MFESTQINHWVPNWVSYFYFKMIFSFKMTECPLAMDSQLLQVWIKTYFKLVFDLSIKVSGHLNDTKANP